jgi:hypothetical protein
VRVERSTNFLRTFVANVSRHEFAVTTQLQTTKT